MLSQLEPWSFQIKSGFRIRGWRTEPSNKPLIFFLHGNGFCGLTYLPMLKELLHDFDLLIMDLPGHGDSDVGWSFKPWNGSAHCAIEVLRHFYPEDVPVYGVGHSYGGVITALMAAKDTKLFDKCMLLDPVIFSPLMVNSMKVIEFLGLLNKTKLAKTAKNRNQHWVTKEAAFEALKGKGGFKGWRDDALKAYVDYAIGDSKYGVSLKCPAKIESKIYGSHPRRLWDSLKRMESQCHILMANRSFPFIRQSVNQLDGLERYTYERIEGGHCFMQEDPDHAAGLVKKWLLAD